ncbi:MAG TPA: M67 family metallopeptidase [Candidatus Wunengus sp. YC63]|uniref:M67 family metallopeptidase n=1 Tax=unclassified Candidatus Wunengus TaxID=3367695 RepID=UPI0040270D71
MLGIDNDKLCFIKELVKKSYPLECCGLLIGTNTSEKRVVEVCPVQNKNFERAHDRYVIEKDDFEKVDKEAVKKGLQIIGVYHSHPDHPAVPSVYDTEHACSWFSYIIVAIEKGEEFDTKSWVFNEGKKQFEEEEIKVC